MESTAGLAGDRAIGARLGAGALAAGWAVLFFGLIDLSVSVVPSAYPEFARFIVLEASWGLLYTVLVPAPLVAWAVRPVPWVGPQVVGIAAAVLVSGVAARAWGQVVVALLVTACAAFPRMWRPGPRWSFRPLVTQPAYWPVTILSTVAGVGAVVHAAQVLEQARSGEPDDNTWGLMHLPMQAAFALGVAVAAAVAVLALANGAAGWWFAIVPPAACAIWFGVVSATHPEHVGSLGLLAGRGVAGWGIAILVAQWTTGCAVVRSGAGRAD